jgi:rSAM/selenodomain-associated transferase 1
MNCGIAIFVKTPSLSSVKTRLWPGIGRRRAEALYLSSAQAVASVAMQTRDQGGIEPYWAVAEDAALPAEAWTDLPQLPQGNGSLGERMAQVYARLRQAHHAAILIGADAPQLTAHALQRAAVWLSGVESRLAIGRAADGGFWLFGGNAPLHDDAWTGVRYSAPDTAAQFMHAMHGSGAWLELETLHDLDTVDDIPHVRTGLAAVAAPTPAQLRLMGELEALSDIAEAST